MTNDEGMSEWGGEGVVACIILAAGGSTRLGGGRAKQLLVLGDGRTLLRRAAETALAVITAGGAPVVIVLGCRAEECGRELAGLPVLAVRAEHWAAGMGASMKTGLRAVLDAAPGVDAVLVTLCDQPLVTAADLGRLVAAWEETAGGGMPPVIAAAEYAGGVGVPAVFAREAFSALAALPDAAGAKGVLAFYAAAGRLAAVPIPLAASDVDTVPDYERLNASGQVP